MSLAITNNEIVESKYKSYHILPIVLYGDAKVEHENKLRTYCERIPQLEKQYKQAFSMIQGHCIKCSWIRLSVIRIGTTQVNHTIY